MPVIFLPGCRVCGSGIEALYMDLQGNCHCVVCEKREKEFFENLGNKIKELFEKALADKEAKK